MTFNKWDEEIKNYKYTKIKKDNIYYDSTDSNVYLELHIKTNERTLFG